MFKVNIFKCEGGKPFPCGSVFLKTRKKEGKKERKKEGKKERRKERRKERMEERNGEGKDINRKDINVKGYR